MNTLRLCALAVCAAASTFAAAQVGVTIDAARPGPVISRYVYGQFAEHLGTGIYGGLWVGPDSTIPNTRGWRNDVVAALKALHVPLVRWPGGCFADQYHWRDGIGPRRERPVRINTNWGGVDEDNAVGTHEFFDLVEQLGAEAYVNGNLGTGTVREMSEWIEYMTADGTSSLARLRARMTGGGPVVLRTHTGAGHGGSSGRYERLREIALIQAFAIAVTGAPETPLVPVSSAPPAPVR